MGSSKFEMGWLATEDHQSICCWLAFRVQAKREISDINCQRFEIFQCRQTFGNTNCCIWFDWKSISSFLAHWFHVLGLHYSQVWVKFEVLGSWTSWTISFWGTNAYPSLHLMLLSGNLESVYIHPMYILVSGVIYIYISLLELPLRMAY